MMMPKKDDQSAIDASHGGESRRIMNTRAKTEEKAGNNATQPSCQRKGEVDSLPFYLT